MGSHQGRVEGEDKGFGSDLIQCVDLAIIVEEEQNRTEWEQLLSKFHTFNLNFSSVLVIRGFFKLSFLLIVAFLLHRARGPGRCTQP